MATAESVKSKIRDLISRANETTGASSTNLTSGVTALINGYGKGGEGEPYDGLIIINGEPAKDVIDYTEEARTEGYNNGVNVGYNKGYNEGYKSAIEDIPDGDTVRYGYDS